MKGLDRADSLCERTFSGVEKLKDMVEAARKQLCGGATFYQDVSQEELVSVIRATHAELSITTPTGHWYYCANGHPVSCFPVSQPGIALIANNIAVYSSQSITVDGQWWRRSARSVGRRLVVLAIDTLLVFKVQRSWRPLRPG